MRLDVPFNASRRVVDARGTPKGFSIQNVGAVDVYYSDDQNQLDKVINATNLPTAGHLLAAGAPIPPPVVYPIFGSGQIFVRAQNVGAQIEILIFDVVIATVPECSGT